MTRISADTIIRENPRDPRHPCSIYTKFGKQTKFINSLNNCVYRVWSIDLHLLTIMNHAVYGLLCADDCAGESRGARDSETI